MRRQFIYFFSYLWPQHINQGWLYTQTNRTFTNDLPFSHNHLSELGVFLSLRDILWLFSVVTTTLTEVSSLEQ